METMIEAHGLVKRYGDVVALDGLDLTVATGTVVALLGPNGAGKTTTISILTTLVRPEAGTASVAGADVRTEPGAVRRRIGLSGQYAAVDEELTGTENLELIGGLYHLGRRRARLRAAELLERFELTDAAGRPVGTWSGGMRRRLDLAGALVAAPPVLVLDEPTTGLDPRSRSGLWEIVRGLVAGGTTVVLTTQYMEEADQLADEIVVIDHGRSIARGTAGQLKARVGGERIDVHVETDDDLPDARQVLSGYAAGDIHVDRRRMTVPIAGGARTLTAALRALDTEGVGVADVGLRRPTLDDVFMTLTGRATTDNHPGSELDPDPRTARVPQEV